MPDDFVTLPKRCEHIDKAEHLYFEMLVAHGESHDALVESGLAKNGFGMAVD